MQVKGLAINISCSLFQVVFTGFLAVSVFYLGGYFIEGLIWIITGNAHEGIVLAPIFSAILSMILYAFGWFVFWYVVNPDGKKDWLYIRIFFGWIPLIAYLVYFRPTPADPLSMQLVSASNQFIFSTVVTAAILFPLYCIWLNRYALVREIRRQRKRFLYIGFFTLMIIGGIVYPLAWNTMGLIYK